MSLIRGSRTPGAAIPNETPRDALGELDQRNQRRLMPLLLAAYIMSFLDRTNIGLAKERLEVDLGISAAAYGLGAGLFFLTYAISEVPSNLIMYRVGARWWITRIMLTWGVVSACMAFVQGEKSFYAMRLLLGAAEAGLLPGILLYFTYWFRSEIRGRAIGLLLLGASIASVVGNPLGGLLMEMDGLGGWHGWQWMFVIEGVPCLFLAFAIFRFLPDGPAKAPWLTAEEARLVQDAVTREQTEGAEAAGNGSRSGFLLTVLRDKQMLLAIFANWTHQVALYSVVYFLPGIIGGWGDLSPFTIGLLTGLPWLTAAVGAVLVPPRATTPRRSRNFVVVGLLMMFTGLIVAAVAGPVIALLGFCFTGLAFFVVQPLLFNFPATRLSGKTLAGGLALLNTIGITGGFVGPYIMGYAEDATGNHLSGLWVSIVLLALGALAATRLRFSPKS
ncbi:MFS transporter [Streptomyces sp. NPDC051658]|uniref:MFS transporter n=1 Tax=Streptomyces sp. NPDC051658 TaxID=3365667 RepID=UPI00379C3565